MTNTDQQQLTAEQAKKYLARGGVSCPFCGSLELDAQHFETDCQRAYQKVKCLSCGRRWHDGYTLDSVADDEAGEFIYAEDAGEENQPASSGRDALLQAAKCALADMEGLVFGTDICPDDPEDDSPVAQTIRELRSVIADAGKRPPTVELPLEIAKGLLCLEDDDSRAEAYAEELAALREAVGAVEGGEAQ